MELRSSEQWLSTVLLSNGIKCSVVWQFNISEECTASVFRLKSKHSKKQAGCLYIYPKYQSTSAKLCAITFPEGRKCDVSRKKYSTRIITFVLGSKAFPIIKMVNNLLLEWFLRICHYACDWVWLLFHGHLWYVSVNHWFKCRCFHTTAQWFTKMHNKHFQKSSLTLIVTKVPLQQ